jgi:hypothetical protein
LQAYISLSAGHHYKLNIIACNQVLIDVKVKIRKMDIELFTEFTLFNALGNQLGNNQKSIGCLTTFPATIIS